MPNWQEVLEEIREAQEKGHPSPVSQVRGKYLNQLSKYTRRNVIAYYSGFLSAPHTRYIAINDDDTNGFMLCCHDLDKTKGLDLILHTGGGDLNATESLVIYLKGIFGTDIRAIIPQIAMSAGTMMAVACKSIVMGKQSSLGPTDPQMNGFPAYAVREQFNRACVEIAKNPSVALAWQPILGQIGISFLEQCNLAIERGEDFVAWALKENMLKNDSNASAKAKKIAKTLSNLKKNKSHGKRFHYTDCKNMGLGIEILERDQKLQDLVLSVHHCYIHALGTTGNIMKVIENHKGHIWGKQLPS